VERARSQRPAVPQGTRAAKDLTVEEPRPFGLELDGYAHLPRMLDKARATLAGTAGSYQFGCPVDHTCMARLGVLPELILDLAARHADDGRVLQELREHGVAAADEAWFDAVAVEDELQQQGIYLRVRRGEELPEVGQCRLFAGTDHGADVDVVLVELASGHSEAGPPAAAQVWVIQQGRGTFFLGSLQARIVQAGEVARIPAGVRWRCENSAAGTLRAMAVRPARAG